MNKRMLTLVILIISSCLSTQSINAQFPTSVVEGTTFREPENIAEALQLGFWAFNQRHYGISAWAFEWAARTGQLTDKGRAICYWFLGVNYRILDKQDKAVEALLFFSIIARDLLNDLEFAQLNNLRIKILDAENFVETLWRKKNEEKPLEIPNKFDIKY